MIVLKIVEEMLFLPFYPVATAAVPISTAVGVGDFYHNYDY